MMFSYDRKWEHQFCTSFIWRQNCCHGNCTMSVVLYLVWFVLQVPSFKSTALIFLKIFCILWFFFLLNHWRRHQSFNKNLNISRMRSNISKTKTPYFFCSKGLQNKLHLFFYFISTLRLKAKGSIKREPSIFLRALKCKPSWKLSKKSRIIDKSCKYSKIQGVILNPCDLTLTFHSVL